MVRAFNEPFLDRFMATSSAGTPRRRLTRSCPITWALAEAVSLRKMGGYRMSKSEMTTVITAKPEDSL
ncbi:hypothetical protein E2P65_05515 [Candidatus Bathyarchaeota archaeon]|nr:hypothetical protein E2P65_05515 [Candidatus Bathyarchaeota archaeon]